MFIDWFVFLCLMLRRPPGSTRTYPLFPYTPLFRSVRLRAISRYPADDPPRLLGDDAMVGEMFALEQVAIAGISIERRTRRDQGGDGRSVGRDRPAEPHIGIRGRKRVEIFRWRP